MFHIKKVVQAKRMNKNKQTNKQTKSKQNNPSKETKILGNDWKQSEKTALMKIKTGKLEKLVHFIHAITIYTFCIIWLFLVTLDKSTFFKAMMWHLIFCSSLKKIPFFSKYLCFLSASSKLLLTGQISLRRSRTIIKAKMNVPC